MARQRNVKPRKEEAEAEAEVEVDAQPEPQPSSGGTSALAAAAGLLVLVVVFGVAWSAFVPVPAPAKEASGQQQQHARQGRAVETNGVPNFCQGGERCFRVRVYPNGGNNTVEPGDPDNGVDAFVSHSTPLQQLADYAGPAIASVSRDFAFGYENEKVDSIVIHTSWGLPAKNLKHVQNGTLLYAVPDTDVWVWPGVRIGHQEMLPDAVSSAGYQLRVTTVAMVPRVFRVEEFLSDEECDEIIELAKKTGMFRSKLFEQGNPDAETQARTSQQAWLEGETPTSKKISARVSKLTRIPEDHGELLQVVHYDEYAHYHSHHDFFQPSQYKTQDWMGLGHGRNRLATMLFYLNEVEEGGSTNFMYGPGKDSLAPGQPIESYADCDHGLNVMPIKRSAALFYSMRPEGVSEGSLDPLSLHAGCDVIKGEKWASNKWLYNVPLVKAQVPERKGIHVKWEERQRQLEARWQQRYNQGLVDQYGSEDH